MPAPSDPGAPDSPPSVPSAPSLPEFAEFALAPVALGLVEYARAFVGAGAAAGAPLHVIEDVERAFCVAVTDARRAGAQAKFAIGNAAWAHARGDEPWCAAMRHVFEAHRVELVPPPPHGRKKRRRSRLERVGGGF